MCVEVHIRNEIVDLKAAAFMHSKRNMMSWLYLNFGIIIAFSYLRDLCMSQYLIFPEISWGKQSPTRINKIPLEESILQSNLTKQPRSY